MWVDLAVARRTNRVKSMFGPGHGESNGPAPDNDYVFSIAGFQRKLDSHYVEGKRPPLLEAFFVHRLHEDYKQSLIEADCPNPLILAGLLVSEVYLLAPPWTDIDRAFNLVRGAGIITAQVANDFAMAISEEGRRLYGEAMQLAREASPFQQHLMAAKPPAWPLHIAIKRIQAAEDAVGDAVGQAMDVFGRWSSCSTEIEGLTFHTACTGLDVVGRVDFVVAHCREDLAWLSKRLTRVPPGARLLVYEKCGQAIAPEELAQKLPAGHFQAIHQIERADIGAARGDECSAYLTHILGHYDRLADQTIFLQSDPMDHLHFEFLDLVLRSIAAGTYNTSFLPLNGPRHVRTLTPCLQAVHEEIFQANLTELLGPYCCAQFAVSRETIRRHDKDFYLRMLGLVDGSKNVDLCGMEGTKRSTQCYGFEFLWHVVFGQVPEPASREDDPQLPVHLRLKHGKEHTRRNWVGMPLARDIPLKMFPDQEHGNPMHGA
ncbi:unnamed protein product [Durusdinium trenchii]|uniref:Terpene synthase n=1 Tax=Durusdinium trenchii TaxID=1381693 RepID=A0ABP0H791_9DINO